MKKLISVVALLALVASSFGLTIVWKANPAEEEITGYRIWYAQGGGSFQLLAETTNTSYTVTNLVPGVYKFRLTAKNIWAESPPSDEATTPPPPTSPRVPTLYVVVGSQTNAIINLK